MKSADRLGILVMPDKEDGQVEVQEFESEEMASAVLRTVAQRWSAGGFSFPKDWDVLTGKILPMSRRIWACHSSLSTTNRRPGASSNPIRWPEPDRPARDGVRAVGVTLACTPGYFGSPSDRTRPPRAAPTTATASFLCRLRRGAVRSVLRSLLRRSPA